MIRGLALGVALLSLTVVGRAGLAQGLPAKPPTRKAQPASEHQSHPLPDAPPAAPPAAPPGTSPDRRTAGAGTGLETLPPSQRGHLYRPPAARKWLFLGGGLGVGFFVPPDVNRYIDGWYEENSDKIAADFPDMFFYAAVQLKVTFKALEHLRFHLVGELGWAPATKQTDDQKRTFHYVRVSPGVEITAHLPVGRLKAHSLFLGAGALYHWMTIQPFAAGNIGGRALVGWCVYSGRFVMSAAAVFDYVRADTGETLGIGSDFAREMHLDYTGVTLRFSLQYGLI